MSQEDTRIDLSEMKDTDPIISYEQTEEAELVELNSTWDNIVNTFKHNRLAMIGLVVIVLIILAAVFAPVVSLLAVGYGYHVYAGGESAEPVYRAEPDQLGHDGENGSRPNIAAA